MLKNVLSITAALAAISAGSVAFAQDAPNTRDSFSNKFYVGVYAGSVLNADADVGGGSIDLGDGSALQGTIGYNTGWGIGLEGSATQLDFDVLGGAIDVNARAFTGNAVLQVPLGGDAFDTYATVGYGVVYGEANFGFGGVDGEGQIWTAGAGIRFPVTETITGDISYRHYETVDFEIAGTDVDATADAVLAGVIISWG
jgi:opacity protein-like surface antigen